ARFASDGTRVLTTSFDNTARLWDVKRGSEIARFRHDGRVWSAIFSPDGDKVLTASSDGTARLWNIPDGRELMRFVGHGGPYHRLLVASAVFSPDAKLVLTASHDGTARLWDRATGQTIRVFGDTEYHSPKIELAKFSPDGKRIVIVPSEAVGPSQFSATLLDAGNGKVIANLAPVRSAVFSSDSRRILTPSHDATARLWDAENGAELLRFQGHRDVLFAAALSPDGRRVVTASRDNKAHIWDIAGARALRRFEGHEGAVASAVFSPDGKRVLTASSDMSVRLWDMTNGDELKRFTGPPANISDVPDGKNYLEDAVFSPDGASVLARSVFDSKAWLWDTSTGSLRRSFEAGSAVLNVASFSPDGTRLLTASSPPDVRVWDVATGREILKLDLGLKNPFGV